MNRCGAPGCAYLLTDAAWCPTHTRELLEIINHGIALCDRLINEKRKTMKHPEDIVPRAQKTLEDLEAMNGASDQATTITTGGEPFTDAGGAPLGATALETTHVDVCQINLAYETVEHLGTIEQLREQFPTLAFFEIRRDKQ